MRALITGAAGFVGHYLVDELSSAGVEIHATKLPGEVLNDDRVETVDVDVADADAVRDVVAQVQPDRVFHLAALSSVAESWRNPVGTLAVNVFGAVNVLEAVRHESPACRVVLVGSSEEYGFASAQSACLTETDVPQPGNVYAVSKVTQNLLGGVYSRAYGMGVVMVRAFNHIGPGQSDRFVVSDFCHQVARIERGLQDPVIRVGNLSARRDFCDVRDIVRAYVLLAESGQTGQTYNVGSGRAVPVSQVLDHILQLSKVPVHVEIDPDKYRPVDVPQTLADITKLQAATDWSAAYSLEDTVSNVLDWWRSRLDGGPGTS